MNRFAQLVAHLAHERRPEARIAWLGDYFRHVQDPDRGYALGILTGSLRPPRLSGDMIDSLIAERCDPHLWSLSRNYVGDLHEALALSWPARAGANRVPAFADLIAGGAWDEHRLGHWLDALDADGRWVLLKLCCGGLRLSVHAQAAKAAIAALGGRTFAEIEAVWPGLTPPYNELFAWLEGRGPSLRGAAIAPMRAMMQSLPLAQAMGTPRGVLAEWKWDGRRVQLVRGNGFTRLYATSGEDLSARYPEIGRGLGGDIAIDAILMPHAATRSDAYLVAFDLPDHGEWPIERRRARLEALLTQWRPPFIRFSPEIADPDPECAPEGADGVLLKAAGSLYRAGRSHGHWHEWTRKSREADLVLMYANPGPEFVFGGWRGGELLSIGKAQADDAVLAEIRSFIEDHVVERRGPALIVKPELVARIAYDHADPSRRHRSGLCLRDARIIGLRPGAAPQQAASIEALGSNAMPSCGNRIPMSPLDQ